MCIASLRKVELLKWWRGRSRRVLLLLPQSPHCYSPWHLLQRAMCFSSLPICTRLVSMWSGLPNQDPSSTWMHCHIWQAWWASIRSILRGLAPLRLSCCTGPFKDLWRKEKWLDFSSGKPWNQRRGHSNERYRSEYERPQIESLNWPRGVVIGMGMDRVAFHEMPKRGTVTSKPIIHVFFPFSTQKPAWIIKQSRYNYFIFVSRYCRVTSSSHFFVIGWREGWK